MRLPTLALLPLSFLLIGDDVPPPVQTVTVAAGDSLATISARYDTPGGPYRLAHVNRDRIDHPDLIEAGQVLVLPTGDGKRWRPRPEPKASRSWTATSSSSSSPSVSSSHSSGGDVWWQLAQCESGGDWSANTGNGYYGGLQHSLTTWRAFGGSGYPHEHSAAAQIAVATRVQAAQGWGAWPACSEKLGLR